MKPACPGGLYSQNTSEWNRNQSYGSKQNVVILNHIVRLPKLGKTVPVTATVPSTILAFCASSFQNLGYTCIDKIKISEHFVHLSEGTREYVVPHCTQVYTWHIFGARQIFDE